MLTRKSWRAKLADDKGLPRVEPITDKLSHRNEKCQVST